MEGKKEPKPEPEPREDVAEKDLGPDGKKEPEAQAKPEPRDDVAEGDIRPNWKKGLRKGFVIGILLALVSVAVFGESTIHHHINAPLCVFFGFTSECDTWVGTCPDEVCTSVLQPVLLIIEFSLLGACIGWFIYFSRSTVLPSWKKGLIVFLGIGCVLAKFDPLSLYDRIKEVICYLILFPLLGAFVARLNEKEWYHEGSGVRVQRDWVKGLVLGLVLALVLFVTRIDPQVMRFQLMLYIIPIPLIFACTSWLIGRDWYDEDRGVDGRAFWKKGLAAGLVLGILLAVMPRDSILLLVLLIDSLVLIPFALVLCGTGILCFGHGAAGIELYLAPFTLPVGCALLGAFIAWIYDRSHTGARKNVTNVLRPVLLVAGLVFLLLFVRTLLDMSAGPDSDVPDDLEFMYAGGGVTIDTMTGKFRTELWPDASVELTREEKRSVFFDLFGSSGVFDRDESWEAFFHWTLTGETVIITGIDVYRTSPDTCRPAPADEPKWSSWDRTRANRPPNSPHTFWFSALGRETTIDWRSDCYYPGSKRDLRFLERYMDYTADDILARRDLAASGGTVGLSLPSRVTLSAGKGGTYRSLFVAINNTKGIGSQGGCYCILPHPTDTGAVASGPGGGITIARSSRSWKGDENPEDMMTYAYEGIPVITADLELSIPERTPAGETGFTVDVYYLDVYGCTSEECSASGVLTGVRDGDERYQYHGGREFTLVHDG